MSHGLGVHEIILGKHIKQGVSLVSKRDSLRSIVHFTAGGKQFLGRLNVRTAGTNRRCPAPAKIRSRGQLDWGKGRQCPAYVSVYKSCIVRCQCLAGRILTWGAKAVSPALFRRWPLSLQRDPYFLIYQVTADTSTAIADTSIFRTRRLFSWYILPMTSADVSPRCRAVSSCLALHFDFWSPFFFHSHT